MAGVSLPEILVSFLSEGKARTGEAVMGSRKSHQWDDWELIMRAATLKGGKKESCLVKTVSFICSPLAVTIASMMTFKLFQNIVTMPQIEPIICSL